MTLSQTRWLVMAWITPTGIVYANATRRSVNRQANIQDSLADAQMRESTKPQTGNYVSHTSMTTIPNKNMVTAEEVGIQTYLTSGIDPRTEDDDIPPIWDLHVHGHETSMYIRLLGKRASGLSLDLLTIVEEEMCEGGDDRCERGTIRNGKARGNEDRTVSLICMEVERGVSIDDPRDIVWPPPVIEGARGHQGKVCAIPYVGVLRAYAQKRRIGRNGNKRRE
jgi:hypothetical protein